VGPDGIIEWANEAECRFSRLQTREEYIGLHIAEVHADPDELADLLSRASPPVRGS